MHAAHDLHDGRRTWVAGLVFLFPALSLVTGFAIGLAGWLCLATALCWWRAAARMLRTHWHAIRWVVLAFFLHAAWAGVLAFARGRGMNALDAPLRMCLVLPAMLVVAVAQPPARALWLGAAAGALGAAAFVAWQGLVFGIARPGGLLNPITFGDLALCLALLALAGIADAAPGGSIAAHPDRGCEGIGRGLPGRRIVDRFVDRLVGCFVGRLGDHLFGHLFGRLVGPTVARSIGRIAERGLVALGVLGGLAASLLTGSRGGWVVVPAVIALLAWRAVRLPRRVRLALPLLAGMSMALAFIVPQTGVRERVAVGLQDLRLIRAGAPAYTSLGVRIELWRAGLRLSVEHPWTGSDTPAYKARMRTWVAAGELRPIVFAPPEPPHLHNDLLQALVTRGAPGLLTALGILLAPLCFFAAQMRGPAHAASLAGLLVVLAYAGFGLSEVIFWSMKASVFYALTVSLLMGWCLAGQERRS